MPYARHLSKILSMIALSVSSTVFAHEQKAKIDRHGHEIAVRTGVIFSEAVSERAKLCSRPLTCWSPKAGDVEGLEGELARHLRSTEVAGSQSIATNLNGYKRKYFGYRKDGQRWISVVGLCSKYWHKNSPKFATQKRPFTDMGTCYFLVEYNVEKRQFVDLYIDGEA